MNLNLRQTEVGLLLPIKAHAGAKANRIQGVHNGLLKVSVTQVAEKGKANKAIVNLLSKQLGIAKSEFKLVSGASSSEKSFEIRGIEQEQLLSRLELKS